MWYLTGDGKLVNLSLAACIFPRRAEDGRWEVVAAVPGWRRDREDGELCFRPGYVPVKLVSCSDKGNAWEVVWLFFLGLRAGVPAADLGDLLDLEAREKGGEGGGGGQPGP